MVRFAGLTFRRCRVRVCRLLLLLVVCLGEAAGSQSLGCLCLGLEEGGEGGENEKGEVLAIFAARLK